jgi:hypothetical protein
MAIYVSTRDFRNHSLTVVGRACTGGEEEKKKKKDGEGLAWPMLMTTL